MTLGKRLFFSFVCCSLIHVFFSHGKFWVIELATKGKSLALELYRNLNYSQMKQTIWWIETVTLAACNKVRSYLRHVARDVKSIVDLLLSSFDLIWSRKKVFMNSCIQECGLAFVVNHMSNDSFFCSLNFTPCVTLKLNTTNLVRVFADIIRYLGWWVKE